MKNAVLYFSVVGAFLALFLVFSGSGVKACGTVAGCPGGRDPNCQDSCGGGTCSCTPVVEVSYENYQCGGVGGCWCINQNTCHCGSAPCGGGGGGPSPTPLPTPTPMMTVQGCRKVVAPLPGGSVPPADSGSVTLTLDGGAYPLIPGRSYCNAAVTSAMPGVNHTVVSSTPAGYTLGYSQCANVITCHGGRVDTHPSATSATVINAGKDGFSDLWWHYAQDCGILHDVACRFELGWSDFGGWKPGGGAVITVDGVAGGPHVASSDKGLGSPDSGQFGTLVNFQGDNVTRSLGTSTVFYDMGGNIGTYGPGKNAHFTGSININSESGATVVPCVEQWYNRGQPGATWLNAVCYPYIAEQAGFGWQTFDFEVPYFVSPGKPNNGLVLSFQMLGGTGQNINYWIDNLNMVIEAQPACVTGQHIPVGGLGEMMYQLTNATSVNRNLSAITIHFPEGGVPKRAINSVLFPLATNTNILKSPVTVSPASTSFNQFNLAGASMPMGTVSQILDTVYSFNYWNQLGSFTLLTTWHDPTGANPDCNYNDTFQPLGPCNFINCSVNLGGPYNLMTAPNAGSTAPVNPTFTQASCGNIVDVNYSIVPGAGGPYSSVSPPFGWPPAYSSTVTAGTVQGFGDNLKGVVDNRGADGTGSFVLGGCQNLTAVNVAEPAANWWQVGGSGDSLALTGQLRSRPPPGSTVCDPTLTICGLGVGGSSGGIDSITGNRWTRNTNPPWTWLIDGSLGANANYMDPPTMNNTNYANLRSRLFALVTPSTDPAATINLTAGYLSGKTQYNGVYYIESTNTGSVNISGVGLAANKVVIITDTDPANPLNTVNITGNITVNHGGGSPGELVVISKNNITLGAAVTTLEGVYYADNVFDTGAFNVNLTVNGTIVGRQNVLLQRGPPGPVPVEIFNYVPDFIVNFPDGLKRRHITQELLTP